MLENKRDKSPDTVLKHCQSSKKERKEETELWEVSSADGLSTNVDA